MTKKQQAHALQIAMHLRSRAQIASTPGNLDTLSASAANELERQHARIAELEDDLQFVERWAVHHGSKPSISAEEALSCIQHYPAIHEITKSYKDGKRPDTFNPYARIAELEGQLEAIGAGGVEPLRKQAAQAVHQIADPAAPVGKPIKDAIDALVMAAFTEGGCSEHRMSEARIQTELRKKELCTQIAATQPAARVLEAVSAAIVEHGATEPLTGVASDVDSMARVLMAAFAKAEPEHPITRYPTSFVATFADMARAAIAAAQLADGVPAQSYVADFFREKGFYPSLAQAFAAGVAHAAAMPAQTVDEIMELADEYAGAQACAVTATSTADADTTKERNALLSAIRAALAATQPAAQGMDAIRALIAQHGKELEHNHYAYFELAYTRQTGWMAWITDHPRSMPPTEIVKPDRKVLASGQGDTPEAACAAALAAQAKQGGAA